MQDVKIMFPEKFKTEKRSSCYLPKRYIFVLLGFLGMFSVYTMRVNLSVALVAMVNQTALSTTNGSISQLAECPNLISVATQADSQQFKGKQYNWDSKVQGRILGAFFYGYIVTQVPGGIIAEKFGGKWLFGCGTLVTAVLTLLTPVAASWGTSVFIVVRVFEGLGEGITFPAMNHLISGWAPRTERSRLSTLIFTGNQMGNVVAMPVSGLLSSLDFLDGWPSVFYIFGAIGCIWFIVWSYLIHESPSEHPTISREELLLIEQNKEEKPKQRPTAPWKSIFTSVPMWALIVAHTGHNFGFHLLMTEMPTYLSAILHFDLKSDGFLSALPYIAQAVTAWSVSFIADRLRSSKLLSITSIRKLFNTIGVFGPAVCLLGITISGCRPGLIIALLTLAMAFNGCIYSGFNITHVDMSPDFAGTTFAITNGISNITGIIAPMVVGYFTASGETIANWNDVFYTTAAFYVVCGTVFAVFGSAEVQPWGLVSSVTKDKDGAKKLSMQDNTTTR